MVPRVSYASETKVGPRPGCSGARWEGGGKAVGRSGGLAGCGVRDSAELKEPGKLSRIRPGIFDFEPDLGLKLGQTKPKIPGTVPTNRHTTIPNDSGPTSACFDDGPKLLNEEPRRARPPLQKYQRNYKLGRDTTT